MQQDAERTGDAQQRARRQRGGGAANPADPAGTVVGALREAAGRPGWDSAVRLRGVETATAPGGPAAAHAGLASALQDVHTAVASAQDVLDGVVERGPSAVAQVTARQPPRRWPWAVAAAVAGAAAGAGAALLVQRLLGQDAPGAQEPEQLVAVVDAELPGAAPR